MFLPNRYLQVGVPSCPTPPSTTLELWCLHHGPSQPASGHLGSCYAGVQQITLFPWGTLAQAWLVSPRITASNLQEEGPASN